MVERLASGLASNPKALELQPVRDAIRSAFKPASYRVAVSLATSLAGHPVGAEALFTAIEQSQAPARLLQEKPILDRLRATKVRDLDTRVAALTKNIPPVEKRISDLLAQRSKAFAKAKTDAKLGAALFTKHCAACHQVNGQGGKVGPNLDGIGNRGPERLMEDILDPNRNVDGAFRARTLSLADGRSLFGLVVRIEGKIVVLVNAEGKEIRVPEDDIEKNTVTNLSPMPANVDTAMTEKEFFHLLGYLLNLKPK
jgi:putative heme-binding domain-containing protein